MKQAAASREISSAGRRSLLWPIGSRRAFAMLLMGTAVMALVFLLIRSDRPNPQTLSNAASHPRRPVIHETIDAFAVAPQFPTRSRGPQTSSAGPMRAQGPSRSWRRGECVKEFPSAPPLPLTQEERLLLRLARDRDADSLTLLNPEARGAETARATKDFARFFGINDQEMRSQLE